MMRRLELSGTQIGLIILTTLMSALTANAACLSASQPRIVVRIAPYGGAETGEAQNELSNFVTFLNDRYSMWKNDVASVSDQAEFLKRLTLKVDLSGPQINEGTAQKYWQKITNVLQIVFGNIRYENNRFIAHSDFYLGDLNSPSLIRVTLPLQEPDSGAANDSHSLIVYYSLGLEAQQLQCPPDVVKTLLSRANENATDLLARSDLEPKERQELSDIKNHIVSILKDTK